MSGSITGLRTWLGDVLEAAGLPGQVHRALPGSPAGPGVTVGMPVRWNPYETHELAQVEISIVPFVTRRYDDAAEATLLVLAETAYAAIVDATDTPEWLLALLINDLGPTEPTTFGATTEGLALPFLTRATYQRTTP